MQRAVKQTERLQQTVMSAPPPPTLHFEKQQQNERAWDLFGNVSAGSSPLLLTLEGSAEPPLVFPSLCPDLIRTLLGHTVPS